MREFFRIKTATYLYLESITNGIVLSGDLFGACGRASSRRYSNEYKCHSFQANTSIAAVAQAHQIYANLLYTWRWQYRKSQFGAVEQVVSLVPVCLTSPEPTFTTTSRQGYFELHINGVRLQMHGTPICAGALM